MKLRRRARTLREPRGNRSSLRRRQTLRQERTVSAVEDGQTQLALEERPLGTATKAEELRRLTLRELDETEH